MTRQSMFMVFLHIFDQLVLGAVKCDLCPGLGFAEQVGNVAKVQLAEHAQREDLAVRLFEPVQGGVDAHGLFFVGQQLKNVVRRGELVRFLEGDGAPLAAELFCEGIFGDLAEPRFDAAVAAKCVDVQIR